MLSYLVMMIAVFILIVVFHVSRNWLRQAVPYILVIPLTFSITTFAFLVLTTLQLSFVFGALSFVVVGGEALGLGLIIFWVIRSQSKASLVALVVYQAIGLVFVLANIGTDTGGALLFAAWRSVSLVSCLYALKQLPQWEIASRRQPPVN